MKKKITAFALTLVMLLQSTAIAVPQESGLEVIDSYGITNSSKSDALLDGNEDTVCSFQANTSSYITLRAKDEVKILRVLINADNTQTAPSHIEVSFYDCIKNEPLRIDTVSPDENGCVKINPNLDGIYFIKIKAAEFNKRTANPYFTIREISIGYGESQNVQIKDEPLAGHITIVSNSRQMDTNFTMKKVFDGNTDTIGGFARLLNGRAVLQFDKPVDISKIAVTSELNNDWGVAKKIKFSVYNTDVKYRRKLEYPSPVLSGEFDLENSSNEQVLIPDSGLTKNVTHLIIDITDMYTNKSPWGGFRDITIYGNVSGEDSVAEIIKTNPVNNIEMLIGMNILSGDGRPANDEEYLSKPINRIEAAVINLKLQGKLEDAKSYNSDFNFVDAGEVSEFYRNILSYLCANEGLGMRGIGNNLFAPTSVIRAVDFYRVMLGLLGYEKGVDYTEETMESFIHSLGMGDAFYVESFDRRDLGCALFEMMVQKPKGKSEPYAVCLNKAGIISDDALSLFLDKADALDIMTDGEYTPADNIDVDTSFSFSSDRIGETITKEQFGYNTPFQLKGLYYGTLPKEHPESKREEFAERLDVLGCEMARFPGGTQAHQYIIGSEEETSKLYFDIKAANPRLSPNYNPTDPLFCYYTDFFNWLEFCIEYDIVPLFQLNPYFYYDTDEKKMRALTMNDYIAETDGSLIMPEYWAGDRTERAAYELGLIIDEMHSRGLNMKYWEVGNEDFARMNYQGTSISSPDNVAVENYAKIAAEYTKVIKEKIPDAVIILTNGMGERIEEEMEKTGVYHLMGPYAAHYPYARWVTALNGETKNLKQFLYRNELVSAREKKNIPHPLVTTETSMWKYDGWDSRAVQSSFANALSTAHNYLEMVFESNWEICMIHDLESPYYGAMPYNVVLDPGDRKAKGWIGNDTSPALVTDFSDIPEENIYIDKYLYYPSAYSFGMISRHLDGKRLLPSRSCVDRLISSYASIKDNKILFTVINRTENDVEITARFDGYKISTQYAASEYMQGDYLGAITEDEYTREVGVTKITSKQNNGNSTITFPVEHYSVINVELTLDN